MKYYSITMKSVILHSVTGLTVAGRAITPMTPTGPTDLAWAEIGCQSDHVQATAAWNSSPCTRLRGCSRCAGGPEAAIPVLAIEAGPSTAAQGPPQW
jgi:hypothetical protein